MEGIIPVILNEIDRHAAAWLRQLIADGHLPKGTVDERSICELRPDDVRHAVQFHTFAGIGGWPLALRLAGWPESVPVWTGSCPCQPYSAAGKQKGDADERNLWPEFYRLIRECRPYVVFGEQSKDAIGHGWLDGVFADLEGIGYTCGATILGAHSVGSPHMRQRLYWVGYAKHQGPSGHTGDGNRINQPRRKQTKAIRSNAQAGKVVPDPPRVDAVSLLRGLPLHDSWGACGRLRVPASGGVDLRSLWAEFESLPCQDGWRRVQPGSFPLADGVPGRVGLLRGYGNAIVPQVGAAFIGAFMESVGIQPEGI